MRHRNAILKNSASRSPSMHADTPPRPESQEPRGDRPPNSRAIRSLAKASMRPAAIYDLIWKHHRQQREAPSLSVTTAFWAARQGRQAYLSANGSVSNSTVSTASEASTTRGEDATAAMARGDRTVCGGSCQQNTSRSRRRAIGSSSSRSRSSASAAPTLSVDLSTPANAARGG